MKKILQFFAVFILYFFMLFTIINSVVAFPSNTMNLVASLFFLFIVLCLTQLTIKKLSM